MSRYTADEVSNWAGIMELAEEPQAAEMLRDFARRLRQEEEENKRDPVTDPRPGDRVECKNGYIGVYIGGQSYTANISYWKESMTQHAGATIIRRREVPQ